MRGRAAAAMCKFGRHDLRIVTARYAEPWYVLERCRRCPHEEALIGPKAKERLQSR